MKKRSFIMLMCFAVLLLSVKAEAEYLRVKEEFKEAINVREGPGFTYRVIGWANASMTWTVPIVEATGQEHNGWIEIVCQKNCKSSFIWPRKVFLFGWAAKDFFRKVDIGKEKLLRLCPAEYNYRHGIFVHIIPDITDLYWGAVINKNKWNICFVEKSGKKTNEWLEIVCQENKSRRSYVLGEFFGVKAESKFIKYDHPRVFYTKGYNINARKGSSILSKVLGAYAFKGQKVIVCGGKYPWYLTNKNKWVFAGWLSRIKPSSNKQK